MRSTKAVVIGAGMGGLAAAIDLARAGIEVTVVEKASHAGGKMRQVGPGIDAGPTVLTMLWVFRDLFESAGFALDQFLRVSKLDILARHEWTGGATLDLFADRARTADAIGTFAGPREAQGFLEFSKRAQETYRTLEGPFIRSEQPTPVSLALGSGLRGLTDLWRISPFKTLWSALGEHFKDPRLIQLFARYATYCGSSPFACPATLMLVADVEQQGVWVVEGGMKALATQCEAIARALGVRFLFEAPSKTILTANGTVSGVLLENGERLSADIVVFNGDPAALASGLLGQDVASATPAIAARARSLSAVTLAFEAEARGFPLIRHNVFFNQHYRGEFDAIFTRGERPADGTVYVCAQDRTDEGLPSQAPERLLLLVNAPANGDRSKPSPEEISRCQSQILARLERAGLHLKPTSDITTTTPADFAQLFPATGGALYGQATHGWTTSFTRPAARSRISGLYLAGGAVHPGPGVPMAALSGRIAARAVLQDLTSR